jgi:hypothetical protein
MLDNFLLACLEGPQQVDRAHGLSVLGQSKTQVSVWDAANKASPGY